ncbi:MAG: response regulator, partial [Myxococcota bacterium]
MAHRILAFESDATFSDVLERGFAGRGVSLEIVSDGATGLARAEAHRPDLILLSIELPSMNGFLVCKKLKKNPELKSVPLVILSSDANADEIFEQHKKLRTRAEEYVRKPVAIEDLLDCARRYVDVGETAAGSIAAPLDSTTEVLPRASVDEEIDAFADDAFDALLIDEAPASRASEPAVAVADDEVFEIE